MVFGRMCGEAESENNDRYLGGENCSLVVKTNENGAQIIPNFVSDKELEGRGLTPEEIAEIRRNRDASAGAFRYLFHGEDIETVFDAMRVCAHQPQNEATFNGKQPDAEDLWAGANDIKTIIMFEVPDELFQDWYNNGLLGINPDNDTYLDEYGSTTTLAECGASEVVWKKLMDIAREQLRSGTIQSKGTQPTCLYFGAYSEAASYFGLESDYLDKYNVFNGNFYPENSIGYQSSKKQSADKGKTSCPYTDPQLKEMYFSILLSKLSSDKKKELFETLEFASTFDAEDRILFLSSVQEVLNSLSSGGLSDSPNDDYENEF